MKGKMKIIGLLFIISLCALLLALLLFFWGETLGYSTLGQKIAIWLQAMLLLIGLLVAPSLIANIRKIKVRDNAQKSALHPKEQDAKPKPFALFDDINKYCRYRYGLFWRYKLQKLLVIGQQSEVNHLMPELIAHKWLVSDDLLLIWGGELGGTVQVGWAEALKNALGRFGWLRYKPLNGCVWVLPKDYATPAQKQAKAVESALMMIQERNRTLGWKLPLYAIEGRELRWQQDERTEQAVGVYFNSLQADSVSQSLDALLHDCTERGVMQIMQQYQHSFLLELAQYLDKIQIAQLKPWLQRFVTLPQAPYLRGLFFAPLKNNLAYAPEADHRLPTSALWREIIQDSRTVKMHRFGFDWNTIACWLLLAAMLVTTVGLIVSYYQNSALIIRSHHLIEQVQISSKESYLKQLQAQYALQTQLAQLQHRQQQGLPLSNQFGLNKNDELFATLWPYYLRANQRNVAQPFLNWQNQYLMRLTNMAPNDPKRTKIIEDGYDVLKAHLMLAMPNKMDTDYLKDFAVQMWPAPPGVPAGEWQKLMPEMISFWGYSIQQDPKLAQTISLVLVRDVRQILINQIGVHNAEDAIYQRILKQNYKDLTLSQLLGDTDSRMLFISNGHVPGVFTRKAWEDVIKSEIARAAKSRQDQIDWVLSENHDTQKLTSSLSSEALRERLTARYFSDYSTAWLTFLNQIQWRKTNNVAEVIEQLTLLSDARQSPLIALMNVIKYQAEVSYSGGGISDTILRSAQELIKDKKNNKLAQNKDELGPLGTTFEPLLNLLNTENNLSLQAYLLRITQVRLKLQNITSSLNPQAMAKELAKSVFQGTSVDLTQTRDYGNLIAANLGEEWLGLGYNLFQTPLEQAWQVVLSPAVKSFNTTWQSKIVYQWERAFAGRYPFKNSNNDASLSELAQFLRPDVGIIDKFIASELGGVLEKQGDEWVINATNAQGLNFSPRFLNMLKLFSQLGQRIFAQGDAKITFDLMPRSGHNIARSELIIDKQKLEYFNQMPSWQRFEWPGEGYAPYAKLAWEGKDVGLQLHSYFVGDWAWIRLLESASIRQIDSGRYELIWKATKQHHLKYILRSQIGNGPLMLLRLRNFRLPQQVFEM